MNPHRIHLLGDGRHEEAVAGAIIKPGHLIKLDTDGEVILHATGGGYAEKAFALEDALQGRTINDAYAVGELVGFVMCNSGDVVYAWLSVGENVAVGSYLVSNGDGSLQVLAGTEVAIAVALEAKNLSDSESADERIRVRIL
jgi:hypothetical protein